MKKKISSNLTPGKFLPHFAVVKVIKVRLMQELVYWNYNYDNNYENRCNMKSNNFVYDAKIVRKTNV